MLVHGNAQCYSELYGPHEDQAISYLSQNSGSENEAEGEEADAGSSNEDNMCDDEEANQEGAKRLRVQNAQGKTLASNEGEGPRSQANMSVEEKK